MNSRNFLVSKVLLVCALLSACATPPPTSVPVITATYTATEIAVTNTPEPSITPSKPSWKYVVFGDSYPYGAHCHGCRPFPTLYADGLEATTGYRIDFVNLTTNGGTSQDLLRNIQTSERTRAAVISADIIVISTGANDLEPTTDLYLTGKCGGADNLDCYRKVAEGWRSSFDGILTEIDTLRNGKPTAIRLVTNSNFFLSDPDLLQHFGGLKGSALITNLHHDVLCEVAAKHGAVCVDLRPVLNGPNFDKPQDESTPDAMQAVADALLASGLDEIR